MQPAKRGIYINPEYGQEGPGIIISRISSYEDAVIQARKHWHISDDYDCRFEIHEEKVDKTTGQRRLRRFVLSDCVWGEYDDVHLVKSLKYVPGDEERIKAEKIVKAAQPTPGPMTPASERQDTPPSRRAPAPCSPVGEKILELPEEQEEEDDDIIIPATPEASDVEDVEDAAPTASKGKGKGRAQERTASRETLAALADGKDVGELVDGGASGSSRSSSQRSVEADRRHSSSQSKSGSTVSTGSQPLPAPTVAVPLASTSRPPHDLASVAASTSTFHTAPENDGQRSSSRSPAPSPIPKPTPPVEDGRRRWSGSSSASWAVGLVNGEIGYVAVSKGSGDPSLTQQTFGSEPIDELIEVDAEPVKASPSIAEDAEDADAEMLVDTSEEPASSKEGHIFESEVVSSPVIPAAARLVHSSAPKRQPKPTPSSDATSPAFPPPSGKRKVSESASQSSPRRVKVTFAVEVPPSPVASTSRIASASTHQSSSNVSPPKSRIPSASQPQPPILPTYSFVDSPPRISHSQPTPAKPPRKPRASQSKTATNRDTSERPSPPSRPRSGRETRAKFWFRLPNHNFGPKRAGNKEVKIHNTQFIELDLSGVIETLNYHGETPASSWNVFQLVERETGWPRNELRLRVTPKSVDGSLGKEKSCTGWGRLSTTNQLFQGWGVGRGDIVDIDWVPGKH